MSSLNYPDYDLQSFGAESSTPKPPPRSRLWYGVGACVVLMACCGCFFVGCMVLGFFAARQPATMVSSWATYATWGYYGAAETFTCPNSQAAKYTRELADQGAKFPQFTSPQTSNDQQVTVTTLIEIEGETSDWTATFTIEEGGAVGRCINQIDVVE